MTWLLRARLMGGEEFDEVAEDFVAVFAVEGEGELGGEEAVFHAEVVAASVEFGSEVAFALRELREGGAEVDGL